jgi:hypothetical protein
MQEHASTHENFSTAAVETFHSASYHRDPLAYPGERPADSYVTDGRIVSALHVESKDGKLIFTVVENGHEQAVDEYLVAKGVPAIEDRIPVLSYGANMCPASLKAKFEKAERPDMQVVPTAYTMLEGHDIVWSGGPGINGNFNAVLYAGPETTNTKVQVGVSFLTPEQMLVLHATELNYQLAGTTVKLDGIAVPVYYYEGRDSMYLQDGQPVAVQSIPAENRALSVQSGREVIEQMLQDEEVTEAIRTQNPGFPEVLTDAQAYIDFVRSLRKQSPEDRPKYAFKRGVQQILTDKGRTRMTGVESDEYVTWANPSVLRTFGDWQHNRQQERVYVLPTSVLGINIWPDQARARVLRGLNEHFYRHFPAGKE